MAELLLTQFNPDPSLIEPLLDATDYPFYEEGAMNSDWPGNILSRRMVIYGDGTIARRGDPVRFAVHPDELELCRRLASEAAEIAEGLDVGGSGDNAFGAFYCTASEGTPAPGRIDADLIRARFNGTIFDWAEVAVEPMAEAGFWWSQKEEGNEPDDPYLERWRTLIRWFQARPEFVESAYIRIGDNLEMAPLPSDAPEDVQTVGVIMPRLIVGLTRKGSLVGLSGCAVLA